MCTKFGLSCSTYTHTHTHILPFIYIVICVPSLVEIAPGVPELCWNIHTYEDYFHKSTQIYILTGTGLAVENLHISNPHFFTITSICRIEYLSLHKTSSSLSHYMMKQNRT
jgi:hypothetical protein